MKPFMDENFLLQTETAQKLYHEHAKKMPIIDYHCHLVPKMVADDYRFRSITVARHALEWCRRALLHR